MTTIIPFIPSNIRTPTFPVTLDGGDYNIVITWNISALRYYLNVYARDGTWIITVPLISTPPARNVQKVSFDQFLGVVRVELVDPSLWPVPLGHGALGTPAGTIVDYTLEGFQPNDYNGTYRSLQINTTTFTFPFPQTPPPLIVTGRVSRLLNMVASVFETSTLVYRNACFEVNP